MVTRFYVPKFITIEDKLAGILTFKQLFALLGAFLLSFFVFKTNRIAGVITALISFSLAIVLTFIRVNGKPFLYVLPRFIDFIIGNKKFIWQRIQKVTYKEIPILTEVKEEIELTTIKPKKRTPVEKAEIILEYPNTSIKERITLSLEQPVAVQTETINEVVHKHSTNPRNPYRLFPYIKLYKKLQ